MTIERSAGLLPNNDGAGCIVIRGRVVSPSSAIRTLGTCQTCAVVIDSLLVVGGDATRQVMVVGESKPSLALSLFTRHPFLRAQRRRFLLTRQTLLVLLSHGHMLQNWS